MIIGVMTDLHLGHRQYGSIDREKDFYTQLKRCVKELNKQQCDIVIIAGDIFHKANPSPESMHVYEKCIGELSADVVLAIKGNHTMLLRDNHYAVDNYFNDSDIEGYYLLEDTTWISGDYALETQYDMEFTKYKDANIWVDGITYRGNSQLDEFKEIQHKLASVKSENHYRILVIHQAVSEFCGFAGEDLSINDFDLDPYDVVICGHIHSRLLKQLSNGTWFLQPGSIERLNTAEARDEIENQKGVWTIDTETKAISFFPVSSDRAFLMDSIDIRDSKDIEAHKKKLLKRCEYFDAYPILANEYHDYIGDRDRINNMITDVSKEFLLTNCNIYDETETDFEYEVPEEGIATIDELIRQRGDLSESEQQLMIDIHNAFKKDDETVELLLTGYFDKHFKETDSEEAIDSWLEEEQKYIDEVTKFFEGL